VRTLAVTPLRRLTGWNWLVKLRRMVGLFTFFYALLHFTPSSGSTISSTWPPCCATSKRPFILVGFLAFVLLIPLAATSTNAHDQAPGRQALAVAAQADLRDRAAGVLHFWWMKAAKNNLAQPIVWGSVVGVLLLLRVWWSLKRPRTEKRVCDSSATFNSTPSAGFSRWRIRCTWSPSTSTSAARPRVL
jgi:sulfoxide reductase heme-binding subunit YedZ